MDKDLGFYQKLTKLQNLVKAPKDKHNSFGNFNYRSVESIYEAVKPHLDSLGLSLFISDEVVFVGDRFYIQATATITDGANQIQTKAYARESLNKKGMDEAQVTGSASSYARKYAVSSLLLLDDNQDIDSQDNTSKGMIIKSEKDSLKVELFNKLQKVGLQSNEMKPFLDFVGVNTQNANEVKTLLGKDLDNFVKEFRNTKE